MMNWMLNIAAEKHEPLSDGGQFHPPYIVAINPLEGDTVLERELASTKVLRNELSDLLTRLDVPEPTRRDILAKLLKDGRYSNIITQTAFASQNLA